MSEHSLSPATGPEVEALLSRINELRARVLSPWEWYSLFTAARQLLPRDTLKNATLEPAEIDVTANAQTPSGQVVSALVRAFSSSDTYAASQRYKVSQWLFLLREFYVLCTYVIPPRGLDYASELLLEARKSNNDQFWKMASIMVRNQPMSVRQS